jgi:hypothetical protein
VVCLHDVSMVAIGVEGADQGEEEPSHHHVAPGMSLPHKRLHFESTISSLVTRSTGLYGLETFFLFISAVTKPGDKDKTTQSGMSSCMGLLRIRPISLS